MTPLDRSTPPGPGALRTFDFPDVLREELPNGLDVRVARLTRMPVVAARLFVRAGEWGLGSGRAGLAVLSGDALEGGTARRDGAALAEALESLGARLSVSTGWEGTSVSVSCLAERLHEALALLAEVVLEPAFPHDEVARAREQRLAAIRQRAMDPAALAADASDHVIHADGCPYARPLGGTAASVEGLGPAHLKGYAEGHYRPAGGGLVVAGDVDFGEVKAMAGDLLGAWSGAPPESPPAARVEPRTRERRITVVNRPGSVQSEVRVGHVGATRTDPAHIDLIVANTVLGGAFTSRLNLNLRERHGFTYGVRSRFAFRSRPGPFRVGTAVGTEVTAAAVREIIAELETFAAAGPTEEEIAAARDYVAGVFPLRLETAGQVAARVSELTIYRLPDDYHHTYRDRIRAVTAASAAEAVARHVRPDEAQIVVVGDAEAVAPELEALALGPVEVVDGVG